MVRVCPHIRRGAQLRFAHRALSPRSRQLAVGFEQLVLRHVPPLDAAAAEHMAVGGAPIALGGLSVAAAEKQLARFCTDHAASPNLARLVTSRAASTDAVCWRGRRSGLSFSIGRLRRKVGAPLGDRGGVRDEDAAVLVASRRARGTRPLRARMSLTSALLSSSPIHVATRRTRAAASVLLRSLQTHRKPTIKLQLPTHRQWCVACAAHAA